MNWRRDLSKEEDAYVYVIVNEQRKTYDDWGCLWERTDMKNMGQVAVAAWLFPLVLFALFCDTSTVLKSRSYLHEL